MLTNNNNNNIIKSTIENNQTQQEIQLFSNETEHATKETTIVNNNKIDEDLNKLIENNLNNLNNFNIDS